MDTLTRLEPFAVEGPGRERKAVLTGALAALSASAAYALCVSTPSASAAATIALLWALAFLAGASTLWSP